MNILKEKRKSETFYDTYYYNFSFDARGRNKDTALHWYNTKMFQHRISYKGTTDTGILSVRSIVPEDDGNYRCRVDFRFAPTKISLSRLRVIRKYSLNHVHKS